jgi:hypothetical protein
VPFFAVHHFKSEGRSVPKAANQEKWETVVQPNYFLAHIENIMRTLLLSPRKGSQHAQNKWHSRKAHHLGLYMNVTDKKKPCSTASSPDLLLWRGQQLTVSD